MTLTAFTVRAVAALVVAATAGCASYRVSSNVDPPSGTTTTPSGQVQIVEGGMGDRKVDVLGPIEVSVKKLTLFHPNPTKEQANEALADRARALGADAVINVTYSSGIGASTWGYMDAKGTAVKFAK